MCYLLLSFVDYCKRHEVGRLRVAGLLSQSWKHQPGTPAYCTELNSSDLKVALEHADKKSAPQIRDMVLKIKPNATHEEIVAFNRNLFTKNSDRSDIQ